MSDEAYVGGEAHYYYNSGTYGSPTWVLIDNCQDLDVPDSRSVVAAPIRAMWPVIGNVLGSRDIGITWGALKKKGTTDAVTTAMITAYEAGTVIEFAVSDGPIATAGSKYRRVICIVSKADESQPLDGVVTISFEAKPSVNNGGNNPSRATAP